MPTSTDGVKNGTETDVDCGGPDAPKCVTGKSCSVGDDCESLGCTYLKKCAERRSCTAHFGGDTCGLGGEGGVGPAQWESCCTTIPVTTASGGTVEMDKYPTTAGRMRVFLESIKYDVRGFVQKARADGKIPVIPVNAAKTPAVDGVNPVLAPAWDMYLPTSFDGNTDPGELSDCNQAGTCTRADGRCAPSTTCLPGTLQPGLYTAVSRHLGGNIFKDNAQSTTGCYVGGPGTHAFRFPDAKQDGAPPEHSQDVYDTKAMQCVDYLVAQAFCVWDGGRLETYQEWQAAWGPGSRPWSATDARAPVAPGSASYYGCRFPWATDANQAACADKWNVATQSVELADYKYSYEYPKLIGTDYVVFLAIPGRTKGRGPLGHSDLLGADFELTSSVTYNASVFSARHKWSGNGSWEVHNYSRTAHRATMLLNKYGKLGMRCVKLP